MKITRILAFVQPLCLSTSLLTPSESPPSVFNRLESIIVKRFSLRQPQHEKAAKRPTKFEFAKDCISGYSPRIDLVPRSKHHSSIRATRLFTGIGWNPSSSSPSASGIIIGINRKKTHKIRVSAGLYLRLQPSVSSASKRQLLLLCVNDKTIHLD